MGAAAAAAAAAAALTSVMPALGNILRAAAVEVDGDDSLALHVLRGGDDGGGHVTAELHDERALVRPGVKVVHAVVLLSGEERRVEHRRVAELRAVSPREEAESELGLVDHRREHQPRRAHSLPQRPGGRHPLCRRRLLPGDALDVLDVLLALALALFSVIATGGAARSLLLAAKLLPQLLVLLSQRLPLLHGLQLRDPLPGRLGQHLAALRRLPRRLYVAAHLLALRLRLGQRALVAVHRGLQHDAATVAVWARTSKFSASRR